jgi:hypothetical protein
MGTLGTRGSIGQLAGRERWQIVFLLPDGDQNQKFSLQWGDGTPISLAPAERATNDRLVVTDAILSNRRPHGCDPVNPPFCYSIPAEFLELTVVFRDGGPVDQEWAKAKEACQSKPSAEAREQCDFDAYLAAMERFDTTYCEQKNPSGRYRALSAIVVDNRAPINCGSSDWDERTKRWILSFSVDTPDQDRRVTLLLPIETGSSTELALPKPQKVLVRPTQ